MQLFHVDPGPRSFVREPGLHLSTKTTLQGTRPATLGGEGAPHPPHRSPVGCRFWTEQDKQLGERPHCPHRAVNTTLEPPRHPRSLASHYGQLQSTGRLTQKHTCHSIDISAWGTLDCTYVRVSTASRCCCGVQERMRVTQEHANATYYVQVTSMARSRCYPERVRPVYNTDVRASWYGSVRGAGR